MAVVENEDLDERRRLYDLVQPPRVPVIQLLDDVRFPHHATFVPLLHDACFVVVHLPGPGHEVYDLSRDEGVAEGEAPRTILHFEAFEVGCRFCIRC